MTGNVVSTTFMVLVAVVVFPAASVAEYVIVYVPVTEVFTEPVVVTVSESIPLSRADAPASV